MDVYAMINDRIVKSLEQGTVPWQKPWIGGQFGQPRNFVSTKAYRGINVFLLSATASMNGYTSPFWVSYKQAQAMGGNVKQGEKSSCPVVFYTRIDKKDPDALEGEISSADKSYGVFRYTPMWNTDQCEGLTVPDLIGPEKKFQHEIIAAAQAIVDNMPNRPTLSIKESGRAFYSPSHDAVTVPEMSQFRQAEEFYSTLFHELGHSTGAKHRLDRDMKNHFGSHEYSKEELVAEFCASYLCGFAGIESRTLDNSAAYLNSWLTVLKDTKNKKWLPWAAGQAQKASDYIQGVNVQVNKEAA